MNYFREKPVGSIPDSRSLYPLRSGTRISDTSFYFPVHQQPDVIPMSAIVKFLITMIVVAAVLGSGCTQPAAVQQTANVVSVLNMTVPFPPIPVPSQNGINLAYEL
jgi:hypothetical protein